MLEPLQQLSGRGPRLWRASPCTSALGLQRIVGWNPHGRYFDGSGSAELAVPPQSRCASDKLWPAVMHLRLLLCGDKDENEDPADYRSSMLGNVLQLFYRVKRTGLAFRRSNLAPSPTLAEVGNLRKGAPWSPTRALLHSHLELLVGDQLAIR